MNRFPYVLLVLAVCTLSCKADETDNIRVVRDMIEAVNSQDLDALDSLVSPDVVRHSAATPGVIVTNLAEFRAFLERDIVTFPDLMQKIDIIFGSGDYVAVRARLIATQSGPMGQFPASGNKLELPFMGILRVDSGKISEIWVEWDNLSALSQLGHFPPTEN